MSVAYTTLIENVKRDAQATDARCRPEDWMRWAKDCVTEVFRNLAPELRIQPDTLTVADIVPIPTDENIPTSLEPYTQALERGIEWRYHASAPKNDAESKAAANCYAQFVAAFGVTLQPAVE